MVIIIIIIIIMIRQKTQRTADERISTIISYTRLCQILFHLSVKSVGLHLHYLLPEKHNIYEDYFLSTAFIYSVKQSK